MSKKFSVMLGFIFCALLAQAQEAPSDADWESDPLDVSEPSAPESSPPPAPEVAEPTSEVPLPTEVSLPPTMEASGGRGPDLLQEAEFHRVYKEYNEKPTSVEAWEKAIGNRRSEIYKVQNKDTLSGISTTFFGDPFFWPKIWALNSGSILNPHEIKPGMSVQFFPGSMDDAPTLQLGATESEEDKTLSMESAEKALSKSSEETAGFVIPPPAKIYTPLMKSLPESLPPYKVGGVNGDAEPKIRMDLQKTQFQSALEYLGYYIADAPVEGVGEITGMEMNMKSAGEFQYIFVRLEETGDKVFVVQKNLEKVKDPESGNKGQMVVIQGEIEVLEKVNEDKNIYRAIVKKAIEPVEVGAILTPGKMPMFSPVAGELVSGVSAKIMGGQFDKKRNLFGSSSLIFLDGGSGQGLQEGQALPIYADARIRNKKMDAVMNDRVIGTVKVIRVTPNFATAYVVKAMEEIQLGDYVGRVGAQAMAPTSAPSKDDELSLDEPSAAPGEELEFDESPSEETTPDSGTDDIDLEL